MEVAQQLLKVTDDGTFADGCAEPWVASVVAALLRANATRVAVEIGGFRGRTSRILLNAMKDLPWPKSFTVCELEPERAAMVRASLDRDGVCAYAKVVTASSLDWIPTLPDESVDFVWLDGCHELGHVGYEIGLMLPKLTPGGIIAGHDVYGVCDLQRLFSDKMRMEIMFGVPWPAMSLDLPRLGPAGGIGLIQRPR